MSAKKAAVVAVATILSFILVAVGISSVGADGEHAIPEDGYGISIKPQ
ncbi:hypothetical protein [Bartonella ancashensis]|uniref:Uncharacterized protein n=1 Tax=Bartonella ancashensis TaxID=1318743 RepID=A0A0M4LIG7_9HYPH|nr:hypothetical protein [Bartonella ancashensis]ALE02827.1 hypothetical protein PU02_0013 [Bartonella ancashensis]